MAAAVITDLGASLGSALSVVEAEDRSEWSGAARASRVLELGAAVERLQAELVRAVGDWDRDHAWQADESTSAQSWLTGRASLTPIAAARLVRAARLTRRHDRVGKALAAGEVTVAQVDELARVANRREELFARDVDVLVDAAMAHSPAELTLIARRWRHLANDALPGDEPENLHERRYLHASPTLHGTVQDRRGAGSRRRRDSPRRVGSPRHPGCARRPARGTDPGPATSRRARRHCLRFAAGRESRRAAPTGSGAAHGSGDAGRKPPVRSRPGPL